MSLTTRHIAVTLGVGLLAFAAPILSSACRSSVLASDSGTDAEPGDAGVGKPCFSSTECNDDQFCNTPGTCSGPGTCQPIPNGCPDLQDPVCGCSGASGSNDCFLQSGKQAPTTSVAYGGECRQVPTVACNTDSACAAYQICTRDPRSPCDGGSSCTGFCATAGSAGVDLTPCNDALDCSSDTRTCAQAACIEAGTFTCAYCVYTSGLRCDAGSDCPSGQLCTPAAGCTTPGSCPSSCVVP
jgi:hypothetical protein